MTSQRDQFVDIAVAQAGRLQYEFGCRCEWTCGETDCSGLVSGAAQRAGYNLPGCPNSSAWARMAHATARPAWLTAMFGPDPWTGSSTVGWGISVAQAKRTRGALGFHGDSQGQNGDGPTGHIKISLGDGRSIEAIGHALDVRIWTFDDGELTYACIPPNMGGFQTASAGGNPDPKTGWEAATMGMIAIPVPGAHVQHAGPHKGAMPLVAAVSLDGISWGIAGFNGATIDGQHMLKLGKLNKPIESASVVFIPDPDDHVSPRPHLIPSRMVLFVAGDGGTFGPYKPDVHYA